MRILTLGTFDIPHRGHYRLLKRLSLIGDLYIGLNTDEFVKGYKGSPIMSYDEREQTLNEWGYHRIYPNSQEDGTIKSVIFDVNPDIIAIGSDWMRKDYLYQVGLTIEYLEDNNISILYVPYTAGISTSEIKNRCKKLS